MIVKNLRYLFAANQKVNQIKYQQNSVGLLPRVVRLEPKKQQLAPMIQKSLTSICPDLNSAKKQFTQMQAKTQDLYSYIKTTILSQPDSQLDSAFFQRAHYYFEKQGKKVRPLMITMLAQNFKSVIKRSNPLYDFSKVDSDIKKWCALMEIMHIASLAHDDIVDDSPSRRGQQSQHLKYGSKVAVFSGNYIISKASRTVSEFNLPRLYEIYAHTMSSLASGEIKQLIAKGQNKFANDQAEKNKGFDLMMQRYMEKTYYKSAALMCGSLLGVPSIFQLHMGEDFERIMEKSMDDIERISCEAGKDYGLALQLVDDILDYVSTAEEMGKEEMSDLVHGNVTAPVYLTYLHKQAIPETGHGVTLDLLNQRKKTKEQALVVKGWVESGVGIQLTYLLAGLYVEAGLSELRKFNLEEEDLLGWRYLGHKLMTRRK